MPRAPWSAPFPVPNVCLGLVDAAFGHACNEDVLARETEDEAYDRGCYVELRVCGNAQRLHPAADSFAQYRVLSAESLLSLAPQWILTTEKGLDMVGGVDGLLSQQPALAATPAGLAKQVVAIDDSLLVGGFSPQIAPALRELRELNLSGNEFCALPEALDRAGNVHVHVRL